MWEEVLAILESGDCLRPVCNQTDKKTAEGDQISGQEYKVFGKMRADNHGEKHMRAKILGEIVGNT